MTMVEEWTDTLESLDSPIPCQGRSHSVGQDGHVPSEFAAFIISCPHCGPRAALCASRVNWMARHNVLLRCTRCDSVAKFNKWGKEPL